MGEGDGAHLLFRAVRYLHQGRCSLVGLAPAWRSSFAQPSHKRNREDVIVLPAMARSDTLPGESKFSVRTSTESYSATPRISGILPTLRNSLSSKSMASTTSKLLLRRSSVLSEIWDSSRRTSAVARRNGTTGSTEPTSAIPVSPHLGQVAYSSPSVSMKPHCAQTDHCSMASQKLVFVPQLLLFSVPICPGFKVWIPRYACSSSSWLLERASSPITPATTSGSGRSASYGSRANPSARSTQCWHRSAPLVTRVGHEPPIGPPIITAGSFPCGSSDSRPTGYCPCVAGAPPCAHDLLTASRHILDPEERKTAEGPPMSIPIFDVGVATRAIVAYPRMTHTAPC